MASNSIAYPSPSVSLNDPAEGTLGAAAPTTAIQVAAQDGSGLLQNLKVDASKNLNVNINASAGGALGTVKVEDSAGAALNSNGSGALKVDGSLVTQPVSAASLPLPTGAATAAKQPALGTAGAASSDVITVQGIASMTALKVDGSAVTQPVSAASLPLPTGAATSANQTTGNTSLASIDGKLASLGQKAMAGSEPVVIASDQSAIPTKAPVNSNGSNSESTVSTVKTETAPANAVGFILQNEDISTANIRWRIGAVAAAASGQQLQAGRDTGYIPCAANISICAESGTQNYNLQWVLSS